MFPPMAYVSYLLFFMVLYLSVSSSFPIILLNLTGGLMSSFVGFGLYVGLHFIRLIDGSGKCKAG